MMNGLMPVDWEKVFSLDMPLLEILLRGTAMYLGIFVLLRLLLKREIGTVALPDLLMIVFLADAAQNGMAGEYQSVTGGMLLVAVIIFWNFTLDQLALRIPFFGRLVHPSPVLLIRDGQLLRRNLRRESVSLDELWSHLRAQGVEKLDEVKAARIEGNGEITIIKRKTEK